MLSLITDNKLASSGAAAVTIGVIFLVCAATTQTVDEQGNDDAKAMSKKQSCNAIGGSLVALGIVVGLYDQYCRRSGGGGSSSFDLSSSEMSSADLADFQDRVAAAAANLRRSMDEASRNKNPRSGRSSYQSRGGEPSSAELAARASAQISSFIQNYS